MQDTALTIPQLLRYTVVRMVYYLGTEILGKSWPGSEPLDGDTSKVEVIDSTPDGGLDFRPGERSYKSGRWVKTEHLPTRMEWQEKAKLLPEIGHPHGILAVSGRFKDIVEEFEPGVHQFVPFEYVDKKGNHLANRWWLIVGNRLDSVDRKHTTYVLWEDYMWRSPKDLAREDQSYEYNSTIKPKLVFSEAAVGSHHLWYDQHDMYGPFLSDMLAHALEVAKISGLKLTKAESV